MFYFCNFYFVFVPRIASNNVPLASLVAQEDHVYVNFIKNNNFNNNAYRNNFGSNKYKPYPSSRFNGYVNSYGNGYNNNRSAPSDLENHDLGLY